MNSFTENDFRDFMIGVDTAQGDSHSMSRSMIIYTGQDGVKAFSRILEKGLVEETVRTAKRMGGITDHEQETLLQMINSPDDENFVVAKAVLEQKMENFTKSE